MISKSQVMKDYEAAMKLSSKEAQIAADYEAALNAPVSKPIDQRLKGAAVHSPASFANQLRGLATAVLHPVDTTIGLGRLGLGTAANLGAYAVGGTAPDREQVRGRVLNAMREAPVVGKQMGKAIDVSNALAEDYANAYGSPNQALDTFEQDPFRVMGDISMAAGIGGGLARAGKLGKTANVLSKVEMATNPMALPSNVIGWGANKAHKITHPYLNIVENITENRVPEVLRQLSKKEANPFNRTVTAEEKLVPLEILGVHGFGKSIKDLPELGSKYKKIDLENTEKVLNAFAKESGVPYTEKFPKGKAPKTLEDVEKIRKERGGKAYEIAKANPAVEDARLEQILNLPATQKAVGKAAEAMANKEKRFVKVEGGEEVIKHGSLGELISKETTPIKRTYPGESLQSIKKALYDAMNDPNATGFEQISKDSIKHAYSELNNWMDDNVKGMKKARETYAKQSVPVNQKKVLGEIQRQLSPKAGELSDKLNRNAFLADMSDPSQMLGIIKKSTGENRYQKYEQFMNKKQINLLKDAEKQFKKDILKEQLRASAPKFSPTSPTTALPGLIHPIYTVAKAALRRVGLNLEEKAVKQIVTDWMSPEGAAEGIRREQTRASNVKTRIDLAKKAALRLAQTNNIRNAFQKEEE